MRAYRCLLVAGVCLSFVKSLSANDRLLLPAMSAAVDAAVKEQMKAQKLLGVAVGIVQDGEVVQVKGYGLANHAEEVMATDETVFNWASNSKPLAAVLAMQLVEQGKLELDVDVRRYVPEFPEKSAIITTRHLLAHLSGIPHYANGTIVPAASGVVPVDDTDGPVAAISRFSESPLLFAPGERTSYSSYAYVLLSAVIERAGDQPFSEQVDNRIAKPLELTSLQLDVTATNQTNWATGYIKTPIGIVLPAPEEAHFWKYGAGGYKSNIRDFTRWARALINGELLRKPTQQQMWTLQTLNNGQPGDYGLGFLIEQQDGLKVSHDGAQRETRTRLVLYPESRSGVVVMSNCDFAETGKISTAVFKALNAR